MLADCRGQIRGVRRRRDARLTCSVSGIPGTVRSPPIAVKSRPLAFLAGPFSRGSIPRMIRGRWNAASAAANGILARPPLLIGRLARTQFHSLEAEFLGPWLGQILVNTKVLNSHTTGVQRYLTEVLARKPRALDIEIDRIRPGSTGAAGHAWGQLLLPLHSRGSLLWSPANTGPLACPSQVVTVHDVQQLKHPEWFTRRFASFYQLLLPSSCPTGRAADHDFGVLEGPISGLARCQPERIAVIPLGVDAASYYPRLHGGR